MIKVNMIEINKVFFVATKWFTPDVCWASHSLTTFSRTDNGTRPTFNTSSLNSFTSNLTLFSPEIETQSCYYHCMKTDSIFIWNRDTVITQFIISLNCTVRWNLYMWQTNHWTHSITNNYIFTRNRVIQLLIFCSFVYRNGLEGILFQKLYFTIYTTLSLNILIENWPHEGFIHAIYNYPQVTRSSIPRDSLGNRLRPT